MADHIEWAPLDLFINPAHILANHSQEKQVHSGKKNDAQYQCGEALHRLMLNQFGIQGVKSEQKGEKHRDSAQQSRGPQWHDGKRENSIHGSLQPP